jgi:C4-dicarboxylate transporter, DctM subunit
MPAAAPAFRTEGRAAAMAYFVYFGLPMILLIIGFPIFLILLVTSIVAVLTVADIPTDAIQTYMFGSLDNFPLLAVPFFVLAGEIMAQGGIARRIIAMVMAVVGGMRGSLAVTTVAASELFGAMSHTAVGTVVAMGRMIYPSLKEGGYNDRFAVGLIASSGAIAVVIPPSIAMILYAISAEQSAVMLFTAGILPSLLIGVIDAAFVMTYARLKGVPLGVPARWETIWKTSKEASWSVGSLAVIFGGIYGGVFTPTEAAGVAVVYSLFVTMFIYREVDLAGLWRILMASAFLISQILLIVTSAGIYSWLLTTSGIPQQIVASINSMHMPRWELLLILNIGLLLAGSFLEPPAAILILTPLLLPIVRGVGVNAIHFGIIVAVNLSLGMYTPPFGLNLFSSQAIFNAPLSRIYLGVLPFLLVNFIALMIITYIPAISMVFIKH